MPPHVLPHLPLCLALSLVLQCLACGSALAQGGVEPGAPPSKEGAPAKGGAQAGPKEGADEGASGGAGPERDARGFVRLGSVRFHPEQKVVEADGYFNLRYGMLEYLACLPDKKAHESLISLECDPIELKTALLLLGVKDIPDPSVCATTQAIAGDRLMIFLRWEGPIYEELPAPSDGEAPDAGGSGASGGEPPPKIIGTKVFEKRAEDVIASALSEECMERCGFVFTGSFIMKVEEPGDPAEEQAPTRTREVFGANVDGELITLGHRPLALLNNPLELPYVDGDYFAYTDVLPPVDRDKPPRVTMIFRLPKPGEIDPSVIRMQFKERKD